MRIDNENYSFCTSFYPNSIEFTQAFKNLYEALIDNKYDIKIKDIQNKVLEICGKISIDIIYIESMYLWWLVPELKMWFKLHKCIRNIGKIRKGIFK